MGTHVLIIRIAQVLFGFFLLACSQSISQTVVVIIYLLLLAKIISSDIKRSNENDKVNAHIAETEALIEEYRRRYGRK